MAQPVPFSDAWIAALDEAARAHDTLCDMASTVTLSLEYRVADGPIWHITLADGEARVRTGSATEPTVTFSTDRATALGMMNGYIDPLDAVITGGLSMSGDPRPLVEHHAVLVTLGDVFGAVRTRTK